MLLSCQTQSLLAQGHLSLPVPMELLSLELVLVQPSLDLLLPEIEQLDNDQCFKDGDF